MGNVGQIIKGPKSCTKEIGFYRITVGESLEDKYKMIFSRVWKYNPYHIMIKWVWRMVKES